jgi:predicted O-methyltransferase YrrM
VDEPVEKQAPPGAALSDEALRFHQVMEEMYSRPECFPGSIDSETGRFIYSLARLVRPELAVEIGTHHGVSTLWMARALEDNRIGRLLAIDLFIEPPLEEVRRTIERAGLAGRVEFVRGPSLTAGLAACRRAGRPVDLLFIDGDHRIPGCAADFDALAAEVRVGGYVILHDVFPELCGWNGPRYVIDFLAASRADADRWQVIEIPTAPHAPFGIALLRKMDEGRTRILPRSVYWLHRWRSLYAFWKHTNQRP